MFRRFLKMLAMTGLCMAGLPSIAENIEAGSEPAMQQLIWSGLGRNVTAVFTLPAKR